MFEIIYVKILIMCTSACAGAGEQERDSNFRN